MTATTDRTSVPDDHELLAAFDAAPWAPKGLGPRSTAAFARLVLIAAVCGALVTLPMLALGLRPATTGGSASADVKLAHGQAGDPGQVPGADANPPAGPAAPDSASGTTPGTASAPVSPSAPRAQATGPGQSAPGGTSGAGTTGSAAPAPARPAKPAPAPKPVPPVGWLTGGNLAAAGLKATVSVTSRGANAAVTAMINDPDPGDYAMLRAIGGASAVQLDYLGGTEWGIKTLANGKYWCAETGYLDKGYAVVRAHGLGIDNVCKRFQIYRYSSGAIAIRSVASGLYLAVYAPNGTDYQGKFSYMIRAAAHTVDANALFTLR